MGNKKNFSFYLDEKLHEEILEFVEYNNHFKNKNDLLEYIFRNFKENDELISESNFEKVKKDIASTNRNTMLLLQLVTAQVNKNKIVMKDHYEDVYQFKSAEEILNEYFQTKKLNRNRSNSKSGEGNRLNDSRKKRYLDTENL